MFGALKKSYIRSILLFLVFTPLAFAQIEEGEITDPDFKEWRFREDVVDIPDYPDKSLLVKVDIDAVDSPFEYFIDSKSLSIGVDDVVHYTVVIQAPSGYQNILFEGMRCDTGEYKTYAYGTGNRTFYEVYDPQWKRISGRGGTGMDYRRDLVTMYFCTDIRSTLDMRSIMNRLHDSANIPDENRHF